MGARRAVPRRGAGCAVWHAGLQAHVWVGRELPPDLAPYDPPPYTFERFLEDELNEKPRPLPMARPMTPRDQQCDGADVVAAHAAAGGRVFLLGDDPGVGKTGTAILAVKAVAEQRTCGPSSWSPTGRPRSPSRTGPARSPASATAGCAGA